LPDGGLSRPAIFAGLTSIGFLNASSEKIAGAIAEEGALQALLNTFEISIIMWGACVAAIVLLLRAPAVRLGRWDIVVATLACLAFIVPVPALSWVALCGMGSWLYLSSPAGSLVRRGGIVIFALTIPGLWARALFAALSEFLLHIDSLLVALFVGTAANGNVVPFRDGTGSLFIEPGCSSFSNMSLAILCSAVFVNYLGAKWSAATAAWIALACAAVIVINVFRIGLIGLYPDQYDLIHGPLGATIAGWITVAAILAICIRGIARHAPAAR
jgi:exosortase/archaeosortase family protein